MFVPIKCDTCGKQESMVGTTWRYKLPMGWMTVMVEKDWGEQAFSYHGVFCSFGCIAKWVGQIEADFDEKVNSRFRKKPYVEAGVRDA